MRKYLKPLWKYVGVEKPTSLSWANWQKWHDEHKAKHPIIHFLCEELPISVSVWKRRFITDPYWSIVHRFHPKHQYHVIKTNLKPEYYDIDTLMLHGVMALVVRYVEGEHQISDPAKSNYWYAWVQAAEDDDQKRQALKEQGIEETWEHELMPQHQIDCILTVDEVYQWWKDDYPNRKDDLFDRDDDFDPLMFFGNGEEHDEKMKEDPKYSLYLEWKEHCARSRALEEKWRQEEQDMLLKIIKIRSSMWT